MKLREWAAREGVHCQTMCARRYGRLGARDRAMRAICAAGNAEMDAAA
jgi:hypothetical protein